MSARRPAPARRPPGPNALASMGFRRRLHGVYAGFTLCFVLFVGVMAALEQFGLPRRYIGFVFLAAPVVIYAIIGVISRTTDPAEYYVAGRRVPAIYNGMATGADWMSAASYIGMAGTLYLSGYDGLAYIIGWTGGYCLVAFLLAPYLRKFGQFTIPDFLGARYPGRLPRLIGLAAAVLCSFIYVVAQIYGVGLITTRLTHIASFEIGVFLGLGGILVCSFLGGMRAVTWTQVAQYIVLLIAYMVPVVWLSVKQTGMPVPQLSYGYQLQEVSAAEARLRADPSENEVIAAFQASALELDDKRHHAATALAADRALAAERVRSLQQAQGVAARHPDRRARARGDAQDRSRGRGPLAARAAGAGGAGPAAGRHA